MLGFKPADSPIEANPKLCREVSEVVDRTRYQRLVERLIYLAHTRPDRSYAGVMCRYMHDPCQQHFDVA